MSASFTAKTSVCGHGMWSFSGAIVTHQTCRTHKRVLPNMKTPHPDFLCWDGVSWSFLPKLALNCDTLDLILLHNWDEHVCPTMPRYVLREWGLKYVLTLLAWIFNPPDLSLPCVYEYFSSFPII
jgi:hypothetical protein